MSVVNVKKRIASGLQGVDMLVLGDVTSMVSITRQLSENLCAEFGSDANFIVNGVYNEHPQPSVDIIPEQGLMNTEARRASLFEKLYLSWLKEELDLKKMYSKIFAKNFVGLWPAREG